MFVKNRFCHFRTFPWLSVKNICKIKTNLLSIRKALPPPPLSSTELLPLYMCCNIHHFGITKRKVMGSKLQSYTHKTTSYAHKTTSYAHKTTSYAHKTSLGNCRGSRVRGRGSEVEGRGSQVECRWSQVEGRMSSVASRGSNVIGRGWESRDRQSKVKGQNLSVCVFFYHSKERSILVGTCWLNTKAIVKRLSLATPVKKCDFRLNKNTSFFRTIKNIPTLIF